MDHGRRRRLRLADLVASTCSHSRVRGAGSPLAQRRDRRRSSLRSTGKRSSNPALRCAHLRPARDQAAHQPTTDSTHPYQLRARRGNWGNQGRWRSRASARVTYTTDSLSLPKCHCRHGDAHPRIPQAAQRRALTLSQISGLTQLCGNSPRISRSMLHATAAPIPFRLSSVTPPTCGVAMTL